MAIEICHQARAAQSYVQGRRRFPALLNETVVSGATATLGTAEEPLTARATPHNVMARITMGPEAANSAAPAADRTTATERPPTDGNATEQRARCAELSSKVAGPYQGSVLIVYGFKSEKNQLPFELPDGAPSFKIFTGNRFTNMRPPPRTVSRRLCIVTTPSSSTITAN
ncbi:hypothetical protein HPB47_018450 [Ixodes persulcatus]|uniref:Uncharacterized protein n=1 Tax=Ixodes persulcatus TaxID=34615 RepID=A0AC60QKN2_IXOPE|nr:hypothetical protein HPB47_018450 [Ixodes persulcatus]